jgi:hypothetical protein
MKSQRKSTRNTEIHILAHRDALKTQNWKSECIRKCPVGKESKDEGSKEARKQGSNQATEREGEREMEGGREGGRERERERERERDKWVLKIRLLKKKSGRGGLCLVVVAADIFNHSTLDAEAGVSLSSRPAYSTE